MPTCDNSVTAQQIDMFKADMDYVGTWVESENNTETTPGGKSRYTLKGMLSILSDVTTSATLQRETGAAVNAAGGVITLTDITYEPGKNQIFVMVNGVFLDLAAGDYAETSATSVTIAHTLSDDDNVVVVTNQIISAYIGKPTINASDVVYLPTATVDVALDKLIAVNRTVLDYGAVLGDTSKTAENEAAITAMANDNDGVVIFPPCDAVNPLYIKSYTSVISTRFYAPQGAYLKVFGLVSAGDNSFAFNLAHPNCYWDSRIFLDCNRTGRGGVWVQPAATGFVGTVCGRGVKAVVDGMSTVSLFIIGAPGARFSLYGEDCLENDTGLPSRPRLFTAQDDADDYVCDVMYGKDVRVFALPFKGKGHIGQAIATNYHTNGFYTRDCDLSVDYAYMEAALGSTTSPIACRGGSNVHIANLVVAGPTGYVVGADTYSDNITVDNLHFAGKRVNEADPAEVIQKYCKGGLVRTRNDEGTGSVPAGNIIIHNVTGTMEAERFMAFESNAHICNYLEVHNVDITFRVNQARFGDPTRFIWLYHVEKFNFKNWKITFVDVDDWVKTNYTTNSPLYIYADEFPNAPVGRSYWQDIDIYMEDESGAYTSYWQFLADPFKEYIYTRGCALRSADAFNRSLACNRELVKDVPNVVTSRVPKSGWWARGNVLQLREKDVDGLSLRATCVDENDTGGVWHTEIVNKPFVHYRGTFNSNGDPNTPDEAVNCTVITELSNPNRFKLTFAAGVEFRPDTIDIRLRQTPLTSSVFMAQPLITVTDKVTEIEFFIWKQDQTDQLFKAASGTAIGNIRIEIFAEQKYSRGF